MSLTFDDGTAGQYAARELLARSGIRATFFVNSARIGTERHLSWEQVLALSADGHEIGGHTADHVDLTQVDEETAARQIERDRRTLLAHGLAATSFAYPYGARDDRARRLVRRAGYRAARRAWGLRRAAPEGAYGADFPLAETLPPEDPFAIRTPDCVDRAARVDDLCAYVERAGAAGGGWVPFVFHDLADAGDDAYATPPALLHGFVEWLAARSGSTLEVRTVAEVVAGRPAHR